MDSLLNFLKNVINIIDKIPVEVVVLILNIIVALFTYKRYVLAVKHKNRKLQLNDWRTKFLEDALLALIVFPFITIYCQVLMNSIDKQKSIANGNLLLILLVLMILITTLFIILLCIIYIRKFKQHLGQQNNMPMNKVKEIMSMYVGPILITIISMLLSVSLIFISASIIDKGLNSMDLAAYISTWVILLIVLLTPYNNMRIGLRRNVREVKIFYNQNGDLKEAFNIQYDDFSVNKDFITFYSSNDKCRRVIPAKNLLEIQYFYYD